jgi:hypothetical protein
MGWYSYQSNVEAIKLTFLGVEKAGGGQRIQLPDEECFFEYLLHRFMGSPTQAK